MYDTLRELHRKFWKERPVPEVERQYDEAFRELMRRLEKPERKLVLRLPDTRGLLAENAAFDSFRHPRPYQRRGRQNPVRHPGSH